MKSKKIIYLVTSFAGRSTGIGGHYRSMKTIATAYSAENSEDAVKMINVGSIDPIALRGSDIDYRHVVFENWNYISIKNIVDELLKENATHIHVFDKIAFLLANEVAERSGCRVYITKPGGPRPRMYYPAADNIFVFSQEDVDYFYNRAKFKNSNIHYLPQRVLAPSLKGAGAMDLAREVGVGRLKIFRIARISHVYLKSILGTLKLAAESRARGVDASAVIIGYIQDKEAYDQVVAAADKSDFVFVDLKYTKNASDFLPAADVVVATGRGVMEAAMLGKPIFCPISNDDMPLPMRADTFKLLFDRNFSGRSVAPDDMIVQCREEYSKLAEPAHVAELGAFSKKMADEFFDVVKVIPKYREIYDFSTKCSSISFSDKFMMYFELYRTIGQAVR
ncbi:hypothetical protein MKI84_19260 [Ancylobacter sp. A5.8]|uniref:hypothetical protein n=1 Tax=Ancylobacter gelatini TaxID=2919920 RepID=UPI001F4E5E7B|nr:hypothetical protein [Ancylobacter gelatini]MCJ8145067.1 hypothetical protein [Ancylobacter gelatini]